MCTRFNHNNNNTEHITDKLSDIHEPLLTSDNTWSDCSKTKFLTGFTYTKPLYKSLSNKTPTNQSWIQHNYRGLINSIQTSRESLIEQEGHIDNVQSSNKEETDRFFKQDENLIKVTPDNHQPMYKRNTWVSTVGYTTFKKTDWNWIIEDTGTIKTIKKNHAQITDILQKLQKDLIVNKITPITEIPLKIDDNMLIISFPDYQEIYQLIIGK